MLMVTARGRNEDATFAEHEGRWRGGRGRARSFYSGSLPAGCCQAAFDAAVIEAVAAMDFNIDGEVAGDYRIAA